MKLSIPYRMMTLTRLDQSMASSHVNHFRHAQDQVEINVRPVRLFSFRQHNIDCTGEDELGWEIFICSPCLIDLIEEEDDDEKCLPTANGIRHTVQFPHHLFPTTLEREISDRKKKQQWQQRELFIHRWVRRCPVEDSSIERRTIKQVEDDLDWSVLKFRWRKNFTREFLSFMAWSIPVRRHFHWI